MRCWKTIDEHCPSCRGKGEVMNERFENGEMFYTWSMCHCVEVHHDDEMKKFLAVVRERTQWPQASEEANG